LNKESQPEWDSLLLVCKECRKRKDGPKHLKAKTLAATLKVMARKKAPLSQIVMTSCLGLCPKRATAVAYTGVGPAPRIVAITSSAELQEMLPRLLTVTDERVGTAD
jgi:predicted metal-binding protein